MNAALTPEMQALAEAVADIVLRRLKSERQRATDTRFLSMRAAARRLGVDRGTTLRDLIEQRKLRTVSVGGRVRVPVTEIERIEREGASQLATSRRQRAFAAPPGAPLIADELAKLG